MSPTDGAGARRPSLVPGILLGVLGVLLLVIAAVIYAVGAVISIVSGSALAEMPEPLTLQTQSGAYEIYLSGDSTRDVNDPVSQITCAIETGGLTQEVSGASLRGISVESSGNELIGGFTAEAGPTTVTCDFTDGHESSNYFYLVQSAAPLPVPVIVLLVLGGIAVLGAGALILRWVRGRSRPA